MTKQITLGTNMKWNIVKADGDKNLLHWLAKLAAVTENGKNNLIWYLMDISDTCDKNFLFPPMGNERLSWVWAIFPVVPNQPSIQAKLQIQIYYSTYTAVSASLFQPSNLSVDMFVILYDFFTFEVPGASSDGCYS